MHLFGTDGIRGEAGVFPLDRSTVPLIGRAIGELLNGRILIGRDTRESGPEIFAGLRAGLEAAGASAEDAGVLPTPAIALLAGESDVMGGIVISASHNPFNDNGIKVFGHDGRKLEDADEKAVEARVTELTGGPPLAESLSPVADLLACDPRWLKRYLELLRSRFPEGRWLEGLHLTLDCANGAMTHVAPEFLTSLGARVSTIHARPNGVNINADCGAVKPQSLIEAVVAEGADMGVAFDGDGDRAMFVTAGGRLVDGDAVLLVMVHALRRREDLVPPIVVGTSMTNYNLERTLADEDIELVRVDVGDRYVFREMLSTGATLGGEPSGHIIFSDFRLSGDGLLTTLKLCEVMASEGATLDALTRDWAPAPQLLRNLTVTRRVPLETLPEVTAKIEEIERTLEGRGRLVVRYSGTELLLRVMVESDSADLNDRCAGEVIAIARQALGTEG